MSMLSSAVESAMIAKFSADPVMASMVKTMAVDTKRVPFKACVEDEREAEEYWSARVKDFKDRGITEDMSEYKDARASHLDTIKGFRAFKKAFQP